MFVEAVTVSAIIGGCAAAVWYAKAKFQPEIERNLERIEGSPAKVEVQEFIHKKERPRFEQ